MAWKDIGNAELQSVKTKNPVGEIACQITHTTMLATGPLGEFSHLVLASYTVASKQRPNVSKAVLVAR